MIYGMTGFSTGSFFYKGKSYVINIRSVNHKFLDCIVNLPEGFFSLETKIKKELPKVLKRGRISFQLVSLDPPERKPILNKQLIFAYARIIKNIGRSLKINQNIALSDIINLPDVFYLKRSDEYSNKKFLSVFNKAMKVALKELLSLRKKEGMAIYSDLKRRIQSIGLKLKTIKKRLYRIIKEQKARLNSDDLKEFLKDYNIEEEISRLEFHIKTFKNKIVQIGSLGKILDFVSQEMQREVNTLSAKLRDSQISYLSVLIKDEIEKIREQLQNVE